MKKSTGSITIFIAITVMITFQSCVHKQHNDDLKIWYRDPANALVPDLMEGWRNDSEWLKAFPVGNGFMGAMVFGDVNMERIQLNEKSLWSGSFEYNNNQDAYGSLDRIRQLLFAGKYREATALTLKTQVCKGAGSGNGNGSVVPYGCFQTLGDLWLDFGTNAPYENYKRELNLENGIVSVTYDQSNINLRREVFASYPDRVLVIRLTSDKKGSISFKASMNRPERFQCISENDNLLMTGTLNDGRGGEGMKYAARLKAVSQDGEISSHDRFLEVKNASEVTLLISSATDYKQDYPSYKGENPVDISLDILNKAARLTYEELRKRHSADFSALAKRVSLKLTDMADTIPTDIRLRNPDDLMLHELYFQFGRYLLISSSREGSLPANLQGIWANKIQTPWNCDYHTDINVQMNYWPADATNLSECYGPLTDLICSLVKPGTETAKVHYKASGWCVHPITNIWGFTAPGEHPSWGMHVGAGGWLCQHLWDHYTFNPDRQYLEKVYPVMLGSALFYLDMLVTDPRTGKLVSGPAASPENSFYAPDGSVAQISMGPSHDQEVIHELFTSVLAAARILGDDDPVLKNIHTALSNLAMPHIGSDGRLMEWSEEFREVEPTHRHVSHLYMLHPGNMINPESAPALAEAARKSLEMRTDIGTGWSLAWKVNFWARLHDGNRAYKLMKDLLRPIENFGINMSNAGGTYYNLFCGHPPYQIDGNFGGTSGIAEMLLQSHIKDGDNYEINLLPALPDAWSKGEIKGFRARGGFEVDINWSLGRLHSCTVKSLYGKDLVIKYKGKVLRTTTTSGRSYKIKEDFTFTEI